jgi:hypothetical protein
MRDNIYISHNWEALVSQNTKINPDLSQQQKTAQTQWKVGKGFERISPK